MKAISRHTATEADRANMYAVPQLIETWCMETGTGASYLFLGMWITGDICSLVSAIVVGLLTQVRWDPK